MRQPVQFQITPEQDEQVRAWLHGEVYPRLVAEQKQDPELARHIYTDGAGIEYPYFGAIGGHLTYSFTRTSLGTITKVICNAGPWEAVLDLTDYKEW